MGNNKNSQKSNKKIIIKDIYKFVTFVSVSLIFLVGIIVIILVNAKVKIDNDTNLSKLNPNKYKNEIKAEYEKEGKENEFMTDWNEVQDAVGRYFIENYPNEKEEADELVTQINNILKSEDWSKIECTKPNFWNGTWSVNENGSLSFKFANKDIEPQNWIQNFSQLGYIILN